MRNLLCAVALCVVAGPASAGQVIDTPVLGSAEKIAAGELGAEQAHGWRG